MTVWDRLPAYQRPTEQELAWPVPNRVWPKDTPSTVLGEEPEEQMHYPNDGSWAIEPVPLQVGEAVRVSGDWETWTVKAVTFNFAALTRPHFDSLGAVEDRGPLYTVLDWRNGVRGPCNLVGQSYGESGLYTEAECREMLERFESGDLEVSHRNWVRIGPAQVVTPSS